MITLTAKINLLSVDNKALSLGSDNLSGNNISSNLSGIVGVKKNGSNPFIIGASKLGDGSTFSNGEDYFIGNQLSNENGFFSTPYNINIYSENAIKSLSISFDTFNNRHPNFIGIYNLSDEIKAPEYIRKTMYYGDAVLDENNNIIYYPATAEFNISDFRDYDYDSDEYKYLDYNKILINKIYYTVYADKSSYFEEYSYVKIVGDKIIAYFAFKEIDEYGVDFAVNFDFYDLILEKEFYDNDSVFTFSTEGKNNYLLKIDNWNSPTYPLVITGIYAEVNIEIDYRNLISISRSIFDRSDLKLPSWGIISNTGNIEFNDTDGEIRDYAEQLLLQSGLKCEIKLNNTLVDGASERIGLFETDEWDYDNDNRVVSVSIKDDLEEWQSILLDTYPLQNKMTMYQIYNYLLTKTPTKWEFVINEKTIEWLNSIICQYPYLESDNLWAQWQKLCEACQLYIYKNNEGKVVVNYEFEE